MNRREFCRYAAVFGGAIILTPLVNACRGKSPNVSPEPTARSTALPSPPIAPTQVDQMQSATTTATVPPEKELMDQSLETKVSPTTAPAATTLSQIALVSGEDRAFGVARAMALLDLEPLRGKSVLLKPNFNSADPSPGSTHPAILRTLLAQIKELGAGSITVADRSGMGDTRQVMQKLGVLDLAGEFDCRVVVLDELQDQEWQVYRQTGFHWRDGFPIPRLLKDADVIVQTCNLKTHRYGGHFTLSLKNSVGLVAKTIRAGGHNYMTELHSSPYQRLMIAEINAAYEPDLIVMDAVEAFVSGGPAEGRRVQPGVILAGRDRVAMDAAGVAILRLYGTTPEVSRGRVFEQEQIARAVELGLGATGPDQVEFITGDDHSAEFADKVRELLLA